MKKSDRKDGPKRVTVAADEADRRLDNFLLTRLKGVPRSRVYHMIRGGEVRVNKGRAKPDRRLAEGDEVRIPPVRLERGPAAGPRRGTALWIEERVIYEDRDLIALDKPAGLAVHGGSGISSGAIELLRAARGGRDVLELVHRLDKDTSGCLLVAKRRSSLRRLHGLFRSGDIDKQYIALLLGRWSGPARTVDVPLATNQRRGGERHVRVDPSGKSAFTRFIPEKYFDRSVLTRVGIATGRTHQIRVHAAHIGHPVAGDSRYGPMDDPVVGETKLRRLFLHASALEFESPSDDRVIRIQCPMDDELVRILDQLKKTDSGTGGTEPGGDPDY